MSTTAAIEPDASFLLDDPPPPPDIDMVMHLEVTRRGFELFLRARGDRCRPLVKYHEGSLTLVSPRLKHERGGDRIDDLIKAICDGLGIVSAACAATLFRRPGKDHGIEPDRSYYIKNAQSVIDVDEIDLSVVPPPDLVVEVVVSHAAKKSLTICMELGVREVWIYRPRSGSLVFLALDAEKARYFPATTSPSFPFLTPADALPWIVDEAREPDNARRARLHAWVRETLAPRRV